MKYKVSHGRNTFVAINYCLCILIGLICLLPVLYVFSLSISSKDSIISGKVILFPVDVTLDNYRYVIKDSQFYRSFAVSVARTVLGLMMQMTMTVLTAYPLSISKSKFHMRSVYAWFFVFTTIFSGGLIPTYLVVSKTCLLNTLWSLLLPYAVPVFYVILLQNYIKTLPEALSESASLDGAGHWRIMIQIILPLCKPSLATLTLFMAVGHWNEWFDGMLYINDNRLFPLQTYLRTLIVEVNMNQMADIQSLANQVASVGADTAKIFLAMAPILMVYPFLQKYFVTGIVQGSVKG